MEGQVLSLRAVCKTKNKRLLGKGKHHGPETVVSIFPNEASCLRLITALLMETSEAWVTGRVYLFLTDT